MGHKETENRCATARCPGACCRNQFMSMDEEQFVLFSQSIADRIEPIGKDTLTALGILILMKQPLTRDGVFDYQDIHPATGKPHHFIQVLGPCPHLSPSDTCTIYEYRPNGCRKLAFAGNQCAQHRELIQLPPVA